MMLWFAVFLFYRGAYGTAAFLTTWGVFIKGYPVLLAVGLIVLAITRGAGKRAVFGAFLATAINTIPVLPYLKDALIGTQFRANLFAATWYNHGFRNTVHTLFPQASEVGRVVLAALALVVTLLAWWMLKSTSKKGPVSVLWLVMFATAALGTMIGYSSFSVSYNLIEIFPGALILVGSQSRMGDSLHFSDRQKNFLGLRWLVSHWRNFLCSV